MFAMAIESFDLQEPSSALVDDSGVSGCNPEGAQNLVHPLGSRVAGENFTSRPVTYRLVAVVVPPDESGGTIAQETAASAQVSSRSDDRR